MSAANIMIYDWNLNLAQLEAVIGGGVCYFEWDYRYY